MSFISKMQELSVQKNTEIQEQYRQKSDATQLARETRMAEVKDTLMKNLTEKYFMSVKNGIESAATRGKREKYINFCRDDFKANCNGLGYPNQIQRMWIDEMCNPESVYLLIDDDGNKMHLQGVNASIWNNGAYTTVFSW